MTDTLAPTVRTDAPARQAPAEPAPAVTTTPTTPPAAPATRTLFGLRLDPLTMDGLLARCADAVAAREVLLVGVVNAAKIVNIRRDPALRDSVLDCDVVVADGQSVVWASRLLRRPLPERVTGIDLFERLLGVAAQQGLGVFLLGARDDVLDAVEADLARRFAGVEVRGRHDGYFELADSDRIARLVRASGSDLLFLGMSSPKKEIFLARHGTTLGVSVVHGVGGSFDILAGRLQRAPMLWQRLGLEWLYRLGQEPRRMWRRYLTTNTAFIGLTARELVRPTPVYWPE